MTDSIITVGKGGVMFAGPDAVELFRAATLRSGIKMLAIGITPTRGLTMTKALAMVTRYTGKKYKRTQHEAAVADLTTWIDTMSAALPRETKE